VSHGALLHSNRCAQLIKPRTIAVPKAVRRNVDDARIVTRTSQLFPKRCIAPGQLSMLLRGSKDPIPRRGVNAVLPVLLEQVENASVECERLAGVNGFHFVFN